MKEKKIFIGTSGWYYAHWLGPFYPSDMEKKDLLLFYEKRFKTVELNNSFYHLPLSRTFKQWKETVGKDFVFSVKGSRFITHIKRLKDPQEGVSKFLKAAEELGEKLGPILFQLPPNWHCNAERLEQFLKSLNAQHKYVLELRDQTWLNEEIYEILRKHNCAFCVYELNGFLSPRVITSDLVYIRLHGPGDAYQGNYSDEILEDWANFILSCNNNGKEIYCYFDNDQAGYAAKNALALQEMINEGKR